MIVEISSKTNQKVKYACSLKTQKGRNEHRQFLCDGKKALEMALANGLVKEVFTLEKLNISKEINQYIVTREVMEKISPMVTPEGVVFICDFFEKPKELGDKIIYLDNISDPGNMGTIIRSALALGYDMVCYSKGSVSPYNEKVIAASKGSIFSIPVVEMELNQFKGQYQIIVSALTNEAISIKEVKTNSKFAIVLGNESHGVSEKTLKLADVITIIPIKNIDSLNVAIAGAILMFELANK